MGARTLLLAYLAVTALPSPGLAAETRLPGEDDYWGGGRPPVEVDCKFMARRFIYHATVYLAPFTEDDGARKLLSGKPRLREQGNQVT